MTGHAINLENGNVEVVATGSGVAHDELVRWLRDGPPMATVEAVTWDDLDQAAGPGFVIG